MRGLIIYATCYGSTRQYADWISESTGYQATSYKEISDSLLNEAEIIIIGSWVLAHKLFMAKWIQEKAEILRNKQLYFFSVSGAKPGDAALKSVFSDSISPELYKQENCYQFGGRRETKKMSAFHKFMMFIAVTFIEKNKEKKEEMKRYVDNVDKKYTKKMIADLAEIQGGLK